MEILSQAPLICKPVQNMHACLAFAFLHSLTGTKEELIRAQLQLFGDRRLHWIPTASQDTG
jgi:hypothetical protein